MTTQNNLSSIGVYDPITANSPKVASNSIGTSSKEIQDNFMRMLITQLQNQNPLNPMDNAQFASQLAQMSQLQGIESMRSSIDNFVKQVQNGRLLDQSALIGRSVMAVSDSLVWNGSNSVEFGVNSAAGMNDAVVRIKSYDGRVIDEIQVGALSADIKTLSWDGVGKDGSRFMAGRYMVSVEGFALDGKLSTGNMLTGATVLGAQRQGAGVTLQLSDGRTVSDEQIIHIGS